jgi:hypothetical protein
MKITLILLTTTTTTTTKPYTTKWSQMHGSNDTIMFYHTTSVPKYKTSFEFSTTLIISYQYTPNYYTSFSTVYNE